MTIKLVLYSKGSSRVGRQFEGKDCRDEDTGKGPGHMHQTKLNSAQGSKDISIYFLSNIFKIFFNLFIYFWLCWVFIVA